MNILYCIKLIFKCNESATAVSSEGMRCQKCKNENKTHIHGKNKTHYVYAGLITFEAGRVSLQSFIQIKN